MKKIQSKMKGLEWPQHFSLYKYMGISLRRSRTPNSTVGGRIWPKVDLCRFFMVVLVTFKNEEDLIKNEGARVATRFPQL